jgi:hypothetical protein
MCTLTRDGPSYVVLGPGTQHPLWPDFRPGPKDRDNDRSFHHATHIASWRRTGAVGRRRQSLAAADRPARAGVGLGRRLDGGVVLRAPAFLLQQAPRGQRATRPGRPDAITVAAAGHRPRGDFM